MEIPVFDLKRQYAGMKNEIDGAMKGVLESGNVILGENVAAFEREFASYCGASRGIGVASGTDALHLAIRACGIGPGDEVLTVPNTAVPTVSAISLSGATPTFCDVDGDTMTMDPSSLGKYVTKKTKAVIPVHLYGQPCDMKPIMEIAAKHGVSVIEDCAQAHGTEYGKRKVGTFGDISCFSFYPTKNLGAYGDGGMVVTDSGDLDEKVRMLRNYGETGGYRHVTVGFNSRLDELQAAMLRVKLKRLDGWVKRRREIAGMYGSLLSGSGVVLPAEAPGAKHSYHLYVVRSQRRDALAGALKSKGIGTKVHYPIPVHLQESYATLGYRRGSFPVSESCADTVLSLPMFPELSDGEAAAVAKAVMEFSRRNRDL